MPKLEPHEFIRGSMSARINRSITQRNLHLY
jgi:hypothetical protein